MRIGQRVGRVQKKLVGVTLQPEINMNSFIIDSVYTLYNVNFCWCTVFINKVLENLDGIADFIYTRTYVLYGILFFMLLLKTSSNFLFVYPFGHFTVSKTFQKISSVRALNFKALSVHP